MKISKQDLVRFCLSTIFVTVVYLNTVAQNPGSQKLFHATFFTPVKSFISPEGPAVNKAGIVYAVNFQNKGSIGQ